MIDAGQTVFHSDENAVTGRIRWSSRRPFAAPRRMAVSCVKHNCRSHCLNKDVTEISPLESAWDWRHF